MKLTPQAKVFWEKIPDEAKLKLLNNVWCGGCKQMTGIEKIIGAIEQRDLILRGICTKCHGPVARLIEAN